MQRKTFIYDIIVIIYTYMMKIIQTAKLCPVDGNPALLLLEQGRKYI